MRRDANPYDAPTEEPRAKPVAPVAGRWVMVAASFKSPYARPAGPQGPSGLARPFVQNLRLWETALAFLSALAVGVLLLGARGGLVVLGASLVAWLARYYFIRRLGGITGDTLGAAGELTEAGVLLTMAAWGF